MPLSLLLLLFISAKPEITAGKHDFKGEYNSPLHNDSETNLPLDSKVTKTADKETPPQCTDCSTGKQFLLVFCGLMVGIVLTAVCLRRGTCNINM
ncbi:unnamed protein product [Knipowitschia caucasica]